MKNATKFVGIIALAAVIGFSMAGCEQPIDTTTAKTLTGITLNTAAVKKAYVQNETLNLAGLVVTANYSDSTSAAVTNYTASPTNGTALNTIGNNITVTISYTEGGVTNTDGFSVSVTNPAFSDDAGDDNIGCLGPGGGIIFYYNANGFEVEGYGNPGDTGYFAPYTAHYLEVAPTITGTNIQWGDVGTLISGVSTFTSTSDQLASKIGNGRKDTAFIVAHMQGKSINNTAAQYCAALTSGSKNDWFLPSLGELNELYKQRALAGINITNEKCSSSSQISTHDAWYQVFDGQFLSNKGLENSVRAVRAFSKYSSAPTYAVTVTNGTGSGNYAEGATVAITANAPPAGQQFKNWTTTSAGVTFADADNASTTFAMPPNAVTVTANFEPIGATTYAVTVTNGTGSGNYAEGATVAITANAPPAGQQFKNWTTTSAGVTFANANNANTTFTMPGNAVSVTANFEQITYVVTVNNGTGGGSYAQGATVTITANTPPTGQQFKNWTTTSAGVTFANANSASTTFAMPGIAVTVTANFETIAVTSVSLDNNTLSLAVGATAKLTATVSPDNATNKNVSWASNNTAVATVLGGTVTAVSAGSATITVTTASGNKTAQCVVTVTGGGETITSRELTIAMWDSNSDGWDSSAALRISVNGSNLSTNARLNSGGGPGYHTFNANVGDTVQIFWVSGGQYDKECAFAVYYSDAPPSPAFNPSTGTTDSRRVLVSKRYNNPSGAVGNNTSMGSFKVSASGGNMTWTAVKDSTFGSDNINAIAYANGKFVAVGDSEKTAYSSDGVKWTDVSSGRSTSYGFWSIAYGNGRWVIGGVETIRYSTNDVVTWSQLHTANLFTTVRSIAYGDGKFVAVADSKIFYSPDGQTWRAVTNSTFGLNNSIFGIAYGSAPDGASKLFVAVGSAGKMAYSSDGITWTAVTDSTFGTSDISRIAWGNNKFVAVGSAGKMAYSSDGITWTAVTDSTFGTSNISRIAWGNNKFVAVARDYGEMATSSDGETWTAITTDSTFGSRKISAIAWGNGKWVIVGEYGTMAYSAD